MAVTAVGAPAAFGSAIVVAICSDDGPATPQRSHEPSVSPMGGGEANRRRAAQPHAGSFAGRAAPGRNTLASARYATAPAAAPHTTFTHASGTA